MWWRFAEFIKVSSTVSTTGSRTKRWKDPPNSSVPLSDVVGSFLLQDRPRSRHISGESCGQIQRALAMHPDFCELHGMGRPMPKPIDHPVVPKDRPTKKAFPRRMKERLIGRVPLGSKVKHRHQ
jgi:hypothetical protein